MKRFLIFQILLYICIFTATAEEIALYNSDGKPIAYIDTNDSDLTIFMYNGLPTAYLAAAKGDYFNIYGFNGKHLGWLEKGIVINHEGYSLGFQKNTINKYTSHEPYKSTKKYKPTKKYQQREPYKPTYRNTSGKETLSLFLLSGANK